MQLACTLSASDPWRWRSMTCSKGMNQAMAAGCKGLGSGLGKGLGKGLGGHLSFLVGVDHKEVAPHVCDLAEVWRKVVEHEKARGVQYGCGEPHGVAHSVEIVARHPGERVLHSPPREFETFATTDGKAPRQELVSVHLPPLVWIVQQNVFGRRLRLRLRRLVWQRIVLATG